MVAVMYSPPYALDRDQGERLEFGDAVILLRVTAESSGGALTIWEEIPPLLDTPLHVHANEDELFHIIDGEHEFRCGERQFPVGPGAFVHLPREIPHAHRRVVPGRGRFLVITAPGGFEGFFRILAEADRAGDLGPATYARASAQFGITWLS
jgi:mannose-6-phosphate isomerase-like protein (cupin superfamily)